MSNSIIPFDYHGQQVRVTGTKENPLWVLKDVCSVFGETNYRRVSGRLDDDEKGVSQIATPGGFQKMTVINESGLYTALFAMQPEKARGVSDEYIAARQQQLKDFKRWVTHEVLPSIRKTGNYSAKQKSGAPKLGEVNAAARIIGRTLKEAGMPPQYRAVAIQSLYAPVGVKIPLEGITTDKKLFDCTAIAAKLGILSTSGKPHNQAVAAIIAKLDVSDSEKELVPFQSQASGHSGPTWQYAQSVVDKVTQWLSDNNYPDAINASGKTYKITYRQPV